MHLEVFLVIDVINNKVNNTIEAYLVDNPFVGVLWNLGSEETEEYNEVVALFMGLGYCTKNLTKLDFDLKNHESPPIKLYFIELPQFEF